MKIFKSQAKALRSSPAGLNNRKKGNLCAADQMLYAHRLKFEWRRRAK
jgi:hypothetical protein